MKLTDRLRAAMSAFKSQAPASEPEIQQKGTFNRGNWVAGNAPGNYGNRRSGSALWIAGTHINWANMSGDLLSCPAAQACFNYKARNLPQAPIAMQKMNEKGQWDLLKEHPLLALIRMPNEDYDGAELINAIDFSLTVDGNAFVVIERNNAEMPAELRWWPHQRVKLPPGDRSEKIEAYEVNDQFGRWKKVPAKDMIHLKWGIDPSDPRFGMSPIASVERDIYTIQQAVNYKANILRNKGQIGMLVSGEPNNTVDFEPQELKEKLDAQCRGDNVGSTVVTDMSLKVHYPPNNPQTMMIAEIEDRPEAAICAVLGLPAQVVGLHVGRHAKTYANLEESDKQAWEECIMPVGANIGRQLSYRMIPEFETDRNKLLTLRVTFDYQYVRALQPDLDKLHIRVREDWKAGTMTLGEVYQAFGWDAPKKEDTDKRYFDFTAKEADPATDVDLTHEQDHDQLDPKKMDWADRVIAASLAEQNKMASREALV